MALPSTGQLSFNDINVELGNSSGSQASMFSMATAAGKSTTNASVSNFYGYSADDNITASFGGLSTPIVTTTTFDQYRTVTLSGLNVAAVKPLLTVGTTSGSSYSITFYWSINSTSSWTSFSNRSFTGTNNYYIPTTQFVDSGETLRVRMYITRSPFSSCSYYWGISSSNYQIEVAGTVGSWTTGTPSTWTGTF